MLSAVTCGLPILLPLALAFAMPERTRVRIMASSNRLNTSAISRNASLQLGVTVSFHTFLPSETFGWKVF